MIHLNSSILKVLKSDLRIINLFINFQDSTLLDSLHLLLCLINYQFIHLSYLTLEDQNLLVDLHFHPKTLSPSCRIQHLILLFLQFFEQIKKRIHTDCLFLHPNQRIFLIGCSKNNKSKQ